MYLSKITFPQPFYYFLFLTFPFPSLIDHLLIIKLSKRTTEIRLLYNWIAQNGGEILCANESMCLVERKQCTSGARQNVAKTVVDSKITNKQWRKKGKFYVFFLLQWFFSVPNVWRRKWKKGWCNKKIKKAMNWEVQFGVKIIGIKVQQIALKTKKPNLYIKIVLKNQNFWLKTKIDLYRSNRRTPFFNKT